MKISRLSNTVLLAFLLTGTPLLLAGFPQTYIKTAALLPANQGIKQVPAKVLDGLFFMGEHPASSTAGGLQTLIS
jgi:hypothetical protein